MGGPQCRSRREARTLRLTSTPDRWRNLKALDTYGFVLATALWMTIDLDHARQGLIQASNQPLIDTLASMKP